MFGYKLRTLSESIGTFANLFRSLNGYLSSSPITKDLIFLSCISTYLVCNSFRIAIGDIHVRNLESIVELARVYSSWTLLPLEITVGWTAPFIGLDYWFFLLLNTNIVNLFCPPATRLAIQLDFFSL